MNPQFKKVRSVEDLAETINLLREWLSEFHSDRGISPSESCSFAVIHLPSMGVCDGVDYCVHGIHKGEYFGKAPEDTADWAEKKEMFLLWAAWKGLVISSEILEEAVAWEAKANWWRL